MRAYVNSRRKRLGSISDESKEKDDGARTIAMTPLFTLLAESTLGLSVVTRDEPGFIEEVSGRAFNSRGIPTDSNDDRLPDAVLTATTVEAVQASVKFCASNSLKIAVRSGGHSWHTSWLHGRKSVILDVGDMASVAVDTNGKTATCGPGTKNITEQLPDGLFFPSGHCHGVPLAGYILGGGFGLAFTKYGMASTLVKSVEAVLASGEVIVANETSDSEQEQALFNLLKGSYSGFPAVVTSFTLQLVPAPVALMGMFCFELKDWRRALEATLDMQWKGEDDDVTSIETTLSLGYAPPHISQATNVAQAAMIVVTVWGDTEEESRSLYAKYTKNIGDTLIPPEEPKIVKPEEMTKAIGELYPPKARYATQAFLGDESLYNMKYAHLETLLEPVVDMHLYNPVPPPSHSIIVPIHPRLHEKNDLCIGFSPSMQVNSLAIYQDKGLDSVMERKLKDSHLSLQDSSSFKTGMAEGNVRQSGASKCFSKEAFATIQQQIRLLDPYGVFAGFHDSK